jgi:beta-aspartyl-peptidase (threonine type)
MSHSHDYSLMIHGGAGTLEEVHRNKDPAACLAAMATVLEHGRAILAAGGSALEAVEACACLLEDDPLFNAGRGSVLNEDGRVEMDAAIMDGRTLQAGAVAAVHNIANPIRLARRVLDEDRHVLLVGEGAMRYADHLRLPRQPDDYFITPERLEQWRRARQQGTDQDGGKLGTIGAVALDRHGHLAAATSTGGRTNKRFGRVGDSSVIGAGLYADDESCAVSCSGVGEDFLRTVLAKTLADLMTLRGLDGSAASRQGIDYLERRVNGSGGFILVDRHGGCHSACTLPRFYHGWIERGGEAVCRL